MPDAPPQLDYARPRPRLSRRTIRWLIAIAIAIAVAAAIPVYHYGPPLTRNIILRRHYARCAAYTAPPDRVIEQAVPFALAKPKQWIDFAAAYNMNLDSGRSTLFLHERTTPGGVRRLVLLETDPRPKGDTALRITLVAPIPFSAARSYPGWSTRSRSLAASLENFRFYAGQPDPNDPSRFTIDVERFGLRTRLDGQLVDRPGGDHPVDVHLDWPFSFPRKVK